MQRTLFEQEHRSGTCRGVILTDIVTIALEGHLHLFKVTHFQKFCQVSLCQAIKNNKRYALRYKHVTVHNALRQQRRRRRRKMRKRKAVRNEPGPSGVNPQEPSQTAEWRRQRAKGQWGDKQARSNTTQHNTLPLRMTNYTPTVSSRRLLGLPRPAEPHSACNAAK